MTEATKAQERRHRSLGRRLVLFAVGGMAGLALGLGLLVVASPIDPKRWSPPQGPPTPSCEAAPVLRVHTLIEDLPATADGLSFSRGGVLHAALANGVIVRVDTVKRGWTEVGTVGDSPAFLTGLTITKNDAAYAVDERGGALYAFALVAGRRVQGRRLVSAMNGTPLRWTNDVTVGADGLVYFTATSQRRGLEQSFLEVLEHDGSGQLLVFDASSGDVRELSGSLQMANGVAAGPTAGEVLVVETSEYRILRFRRGADDRYVATVAADNLPGMPGNIRRSESGAYWISLLSPRSPVLDGTAQRPVLRRLMAWIPQAMQPRSSPVACLVRLTPTAEGFTSTAFRLIGRGELPSFSTIVERNGRLFLSPAGFGRLDERRLFVGSLPQ